MDQCNNIVKTSASIKPILTLKEAKTIIEKKYGFKIQKMVQLDGYDDMNYQVHVENTVSDTRVDLSTKYVFKIINSLDSEHIPLFEAQTKLLQYLGEYGIVEFPIPVSTKNGRFLETITLSSGQHIIRLLEFIEGRIMHQVTCPSELFYELGYVVGKLDLAMKNFHHDAYHHREFPWMLHSVPQLSQFVHAVTNENRKRMVISIIKEFETRVLPISKSLDKGLIHGDVNEQNIIVDKVDDKYTIRAIIDFGDTHIGCYLYELAITMAYMILTSGNIETGGYVLAGYNSAKKVSEQELTLLKVCVEARLCQSLVMGAYTILQDPQNTYILTTAVKGWTLLDELWRQPESELLDMWKCKLNNK